MVTLHLDHIVKAWFPDKQVEIIAPFGNGHINDTYKFKLKGDDQHFILQRINTNVFINPKAIIDTHLKIQDVFSSKQYPISIANLVVNSKGEFLTVDANSNHWRLSEFIEDSYTAEVVTETWQAYEAGRAYGLFAAICSKLNVDEFSEPIKDFHRLSFRLGQLKHAVENDFAGRLNDVKEVVNFFLVREDKLSKVEQMADAGKIPLRVVHNDTKINNLLFRHKSAVTVIDLDTTGPGILYYDYGDALRTIANTAQEDEKDLSRVEFNLKAFEDFSVGYLNEVRSIASDEEKVNFFLAPFLLTYIMAIRFLADFLNGDRYYKIAYPNHNIDRCLVQKTLIERMEEKEEKMRSIVNNIFLKK